MVDVNVVGGVDGVIVVDVVVVDDRKKCRRVSSFEKSVTTYNGNCLIEADRRLVLKSRLLV